MGMELNPTADRIASFESGMTYTARSHDAMDNQDLTRRFHELVWPHAGTVLRTALFLMHNQAEADDLAQETLLKAFKSLDRFHAGTDMKAWLLTILRNTRIDRLRSGAAARSDVSLEQLPADPPDHSSPAADDLKHWENPQSILDEFSDRHMIEALQKLPEDIRWTLLLVDVEGLDQADAAEILAIPVGTVKSRIHRGRGMLRGALLPIAQNLGLLGRGRQ
jgi:RNA polymerase sigma-70 factor (ECF subfamily)